MRDAAVKELLVDFNSIDAHDAIWLVSVPTLESIAGSGGELTEGERVYLTDGELRVAARVHRLADGSWEARSEWAFEEIDPEKGTWRPVPVRAPR